MNGEEPDVDLPLLDKTTNSRVKGKLLSRGVIDSLVTLLNNIIPHPIYEAYIILGKNDDCLLKTQGKLITRKCNNGEIVVTIF